jgi:glycerophosphoryl diester phosphodiesterase
MRGAIVGMTTSLARQNARKRHDSAPFLPSNSLLLGLGQPPARPALPPFSQSARCHVTHLPVALGHLGALCLPTGGAFVHRKRSARAAVVALAALIALGTAVAASGGGSQSRDDGDDSRAEPLVIGHRGASGYRPEHTLAAYKLAIEMGADYIEPDLVSTEDGVLVARHESEIGATTNVESDPEFAARRKTKTIDGVTITGWFTEDFTLAELKTLRAEERIPQLRPTNQAFDGLERIPTLQEVIDLAKEEGVGIYPETKHPTYFRRHRPLARGAARRDAERERLHEAQLARVHSVLRGQEPQGIEPNDQGADRPADQRRRQTVGLRARERPEDLCRPRDAAGLREVASYADGIGPNKNLLVPRDSSNRLLPPTQLARNARRADLVVHPWTFRRENSFLPEDFRQGNPTSPVYMLATGDFPAELELFYRLGIDGLFTDNPDVAVAVRATS